MHSWVNNFPESAKISATIETFKGLWHSTAIIYVYSKHLGKNPVLKINTDIKHGFWQHFFYKKTSITGIATIKSGVAKSLQASLGVLPHITFKADLLVNSNNNLYVTISPMHSKKRELSLHSEAIQLILPSYSKQIYLNQPFIFYIPKLHFSSAWGIVDIQEAKIQLNPHVFYFSLDPTILLDALKIKLNHKAQHLSLANLHASLKIETKTEQLQEYNTTYSVINGVTHMDKKHLHLTPNTLKQFLTKHKDEMYQYFSQTLPLKQSKWWEAQQAKFLLSKFIDVVEPAKIKIFELSLEMPSVSGRLDFNSEIDFGLKKSENIKKIDHPFKFQFALNTPIALLQTLLEGYGLSAREAKIWIQHIVTEYGLIIDNKTYNLQGEYPAQQKPTKW